MSRQREAVWYDGIVCLGAQHLDDVVSFSVNHEFLSVKHKSGVGGTEQELPVGFKVHGTIEFNADNAEIQALLTGGALSTGTMKMILRGTEVATITTNTITLVKAANSIESSVRLYGSAGTVFKKVASSPDVGEFSYDDETGVCTFNASETETTVYPEYAYTDAASGQTLTIDPRDVPGAMALYGFVRSEDMNTGTRGHRGVYLKQINITGSLEDGGDNSGNTKTKQINYNAVVAAPGDYQKFFPA